MALYLHQDRRADYDPSVPFTDGNGVQTAQSYNDLHEGAASRNLASEAGYNWLYS